MYIIYFSQDAKGSVLFKSVIKSLELNSEHYFGLLWPDKDQFNLWLEMDKKVHPPALP